LKRAAVEGGREEEEEEEKGAGKVGGTVIAI
jgi:hypothetical protein